MKSSALVFLAMAALSLSSGTFAKADETLLSGKYTLENSDCVRFLNNGNLDSNNYINPGWVAGTEIVVEGNPRQITLAPAGEKAEYAKVTFKVGVNWTPSMAGGYVVVSNRYRDDGSAFSHTLVDHWEVERLDIVKSWDGIEIYSNHGKAMCALSASL